MGNINSAMLCEEEIEELERTTVFDYNEIEVLYERFKFLDKQSNGYLTYNEFNNIPEFQSNPFAKFIVEEIEKRADYDKITFTHFLDFLGIFSEKTEKDTRIKFVFNIFDLNSDQKICKSVLLRIMKIMGQAENEEKAEEVLNIYDEEKKGYLDLKDFNTFYMSDPTLEQSMLIDFAKNIPQHKKIGVIDVLWPPCEDDSSDKSN